MDGEIAGTGGLFERLPSNGLGRGGEGRGIKWFSCRPSGHQKTARKAGGSVGGRVWDQGEVVMETVTVG